MLKALLACLAIGLGAATALADARSDCQQTYDHHLAVRGCTEFIRGDSRAAWAYANRSHAYERIGQFQPALQDGHRAVELDPTQPLHFVNRAAAYIGLRDYARALADIDAALRIDPRNAVAFVNRAYVYEQLGQRNLAVDDYRRTLQYEPDNQYARDALRRLGAGAY
jgi:Tfp pilus assembly protein PilF